MTLWFLARATGIAAFLAFSIAVTLGASASMRTKPVPVSLDRRFVLQMLHRSAAITGLALLSIHVSAVVIDNYVDVSFASALVPLASPYKRVAVAVGTIALWGVVTVACSGLLRGRLAANQRAARAWRPVHATAYAMWPVMLLHGLLAGTDNGSAWLQLLCLGAFLTVCSASIRRLHAQRRHRRSPQALVRG